LIVDDSELTKFMRTYDLRAGNGENESGGTYFDFGRSVREISAALHKLTKQDFGDADLFGISLSEDPRRQVLQRRIYVRQAQRWQSWWETHWREMTNDSAYQMVKLVVVNDSLPAASKTLGPTARLGEMSEGFVLSPADEEGKYATHFLDLDTGYELKWPSRFSNDEAKIDQKQLANWATGNGIDLMCVTHVSPDGTSTFVLRAFDMNVWEISQRDLRNIHSLIAAGTLPKGHAIDDLLMHFDADSKQYVPDANAAFIYITREGNMGVIETTDRVTRTANLTGLYTAPPAGVGFYTGVRFNLTTIIP
jgi:hypothetical protein